MARSEGIVGLGLFVANALLLGLFCGVIGSGAEVRSLQRLMLPELGLG